MIKAILGGLLIVSLGSVSLSADVTKGQKLFSKKLKKDCGMSGAAIAGKHTQGEWGDIGVNGLSKEIKIICPEAKEKALREKFLNHYMDFFIEFGSDSGNVPSC